MEIPVDAFVLFFVVFAIFVLLGIAKVRSTARSIASLPAARIARRGLSLRERILAPGAYAYGLGVSALLSAVTCAALAYHASRPKVPEHDTFDRIGTWVPYQSFLIVFGITAVFAWLIISGGRTVARRELEAARGHGTSVPPRIMRPVAWVYGLGACTVAASLWCAGNAYVHAHKDEIVQTYEIRDFTTGEVETRDLTQKELREQYQTFDEYQQARADRIKAIQSLRQLPPPPSAPPQK